MAGRIVGTLAAASALGAQAFLIPAEIHKDVEKLSPFAVQPLQRDWQVVELPCPECVLPTPNTEIKDEAEGDMPMFIQGGANHLSVNITTLMDRHAIGISGQHTIYPPLEDVNEAVVDVTPSSSDRRHPVKVSAESMLLSEEGSSDGEVLIQIFYQVQSVDNHPVTVDPIKITAVKGADSEISLINVESISTGRPAHHMGPKPARPHRPHHDIAASPFKEPKKPCNLPSFLCQLRDFVEAKVSGLGHKAHGGCRGKKLAHGKHGKHGKHGDGESGGRVGRPHHHHKGKDGQKDAEGRIRPHHHHKGKDNTDDMEGVGFMAGPVSVDDRLPTHHRVHHHGPGSHAMGHRHHGSKIQHVTRGILMILTPIFLGITMGMAVSILGMIVGRFITFIWARLVRGGQRGYASVQLSEEAAEKAEVEELPPVYEDAVPAYDEKAAVEYKDDKEQSE